MFTLIDRTCRNVMLDIIFDVRQPGEKRKDVTSSYQCHSGAGLRTKAIVASRSDANSVDTRTYRSSWRLTFRFDGDQVELASAERVARVAPGGTEASGSWVDLVDRRGRVLFRRVLHDPFRTTAEHHSPDGQIEVVRRPPESGEFQVVVPDMPDGSDVSVWSSPLEPEAALNPAQELGRFRLSDLQRHDDKPRRPRPKKRR
jgi:hypothetical protein